MFEIEITPEAHEDLRRFRKFDRNRILDTMEEQLSHQPAQETRNRLRLGPNKLAEWELRVGAFRVFYDVYEAEALIKVVAVGYKEREKLFIHGEEFEL